MFKLLIVLVQEVEPTNKSNNKIKIAIFGIIVNHIVMIVGLSEYTSGDQWCNGAAAILNKNPIKMKIIPTLTPLMIFRVYHTEIKL